MEFKRLDFDDLEFLTIVRKQSAEYLHDPTIYSYEDVIKWFYENCDNPKWQRWIIKQNGDRIGYLRLDIIDNKNFIGMDIIEEHRGKGYSQRAYKEFINFLYKNTKIEELWLKVLKTNTRAIHIYEKLGFEIHSSEEIIRDGQPITSFTYILTKEKWLDTRF